MMQCFKSETGSKPTRTQASQMKTRTMVPRITIGLDLGKRFSTFHVLDDQRVCLEQKSDPHHARGASLPVPESRAR